MMGNVGKIDLTKDTDDESDSDSESPFASASNEQVRAAQKYKSRDVEEKTGYQDEWWMKFCRGDVVVVSQLLMMTSSHRSTEVIVL